MVLRSRALEITVEGCLTSPLTPDHASHLQQLLATFLPRPADAPALAAAVARLAQLLAQDTQSFDTVGAADAASAGAAGGRGGAAPLQRLGAIESEMSKLQGFLSKVSQGGVSK